MADGPITLKAFFCDDQNRPIADFLDTTSLAKAAQDAAGDVPRAAVPGLQKAFGGALDGLFEPRLEDILAKSWGKLAAVQQAIKTTRDDPSGQIIIPVLDHRITSKHAPHIDLVLGEKSLGRFAFDIALALELRGIELEVRRGRICRLKGGACLGEGVFAFAGQTLIKRATPAFDLPGRLAFDTAPADPEA
jgi:hypothetical protein